jgi:hypothetical protein
VITTLHSTNFNKLLQRDRAKSELRTQSGDSETLTNLILIEQRRSLNSTITEESNSGYSSRQSSTLSSEPGLPRQITVGTYDLSESEPGKVELVQSDKDKWHRRRRELLLRSRQWSTDVTMDSVELREESSMKGQGRNRKAANHRKLPDIPNSRRFYFLEAFYFTNIEIVVAVNVV